MPKGNGSVPFDWTIRSTPQLLPQPGWGGVGVIYALDRVRAASYENPPALEAALDEQAALAEEGARLRDQPPSVARRAAEKARSLASAANMRAQCLALIDFYVLEVRPWPLPGPAPDPHDGATWDGVPTLLLDYLTSAPALTRAREGFDDFLSPVVPSIMPDSLATAPPSTPTLDSF